MRKQKSNLISHVLMYAFCGNHPATEDDLMQLVLREAHDGEGIFPTFAAGTPVHNLQPCTQYTHWYSGEIDGYATYLPDTLLDWRDATHATLTAVYNPTELALPQGSAVTLLAAHYGWAWCVTDDGIHGWLPCDKLVSIRIS